MKLKMTEISEESYKLYHSFIDYGYTKKGTDIFFIPNDLLEEFCRKNL